MENIIRLDETDKKILFELDLNARVSLTKLAKKVSLSPQTAKYRIGQLEKKEVIKGYVTLFNVAKFGYLYYRLYIRYENVKEKDEAQIIDYFKNHRKVIWFLSTSDKWDIEVLFVAKNFIDFNDTLKEMYERFPDQLHNNVTSVSIANYHHPRSYLVSKKTRVQVSYGGKPEKSALEIDALDKKIIALINQNARMTGVELGKKLKVTHKTVLSRIKRMEASGVIQGYRTWIDYSRFGYTYYKSMITLRGFTKKEETASLKFCKNHPNIIYLVTCVWPWDIEIEIESKDKKTFLDTIKKYRELMGDKVLDYETLTATAEHKMNYCPFAEEL